MMHRLIVWVLFLFLCSSVAWGQTDNSGELDTALAYFEKRGYEKPDFKVVYEDESLLVFAGKNFICCLIR